jgi:hypothetical protein
MSAELFEDPYEYKNKKNRTYKILLPDGKIIGTASSKIREDSKISGHFRTERLKSNAQGYKIGLKLKYDNEGNPVINVFPYISLNSWNLLPSRTLPNTSLIEKFLL